MFQTINWLSTWIVESDAGTYSHRFQQELIQRLAVSHETTPTAHLFYSSFLPRFTLWPMGRREKNLEKHTQKHAKTQGQDSMPTMAPTYIKMKINKNVHNKVPKPRGNKTHKITVSVEVDCNLWFWGESWFGFESRKRCESVCCPMIFKPVPIIYSIKLYRSFVKIGLQ